MGGIHTWSHESSARCTHVDLYIYLRLSTGNDEIRLSRLHIGDPYPCGTVRHSLRGTESKIRYKKYYGLFLRGNDCVSFNLWITSVSTLIARIGQSIRLLLQPGRAYECDSVRSERKRSQHTLRSYIHDTILR